MKNKLIATICEEQPSLTDAGKPVIWVVLASLSKGGAERIVLDWLTDAMRNGYAVRLVVQHTYAQEWQVPVGLALYRATGALPNFMATFGAQIRKETDRVYTHLVRDEYLEPLWNAGLAVVPTVHNAKAGWRNDPSLWQRRNVPFAIAVSDLISEELKAHGCNVPVIVLRHQPNVSRRVFSNEQRQRIRQKYRVGGDELFVGMIGSLKAQKNYPRAMRVLRGLQRRRPAKLLVAGGAQGEHGRQVFQDVCREGARLGLAGSVYLPGFADVEALMPAFDVVLNTSDFEGFSMATQEALLSGLPVVASEVGGQSEIKHPALTLLPADDESGFVQTLATVPVRQVLEPASASRLFSTAKLWTLAASAPLKSATNSSVLFVTANLNAGGAQRSLVNLTSALRGRLSYSVAVTGQSTHPYFANTLAQREVKVFRPCESRNVLDIAAALLQHLTQHPVSTLCFWNADPKLKLLLTKFLPHHRVIDVSPGHYAFLEMQEVGAFQEELAFTEDQFYESLETLVLKFTSTEVPDAVREKLKIIPNGVPAVTPRLPSGKKKLVVQGRIAPSKQLDVILAAMPLVREQVDCELHFFGQAEERSRDTLEALLQQAEPMKDFVFFHGAKPDLVDALGEYDGAVVLGKHQGCPNAVLEALAAGVPVVANDSGGTRELVVDGQTGVLLPEDVTPQLVAKAIVSMLCMDLAALRNQAQAHAQTFSMEQMCASYLRMFREKNDVKAAA